MKIYVGNLSYGLTEDSLRQKFEEFGAVNSVSIIKDRETGRSKGFGFIEMADGSAGQSAINSLNQQEFDGRRLTVSEARPREERSERSERPSRGPRHGGGNRW